MIENYKKIKEFRVVEFISTTNPTFKNYAELEGTLTEYEVYENMNIFYFDSISNFLLIQHINLSFYTKMESILQRIKNEN